MWWLGITDTPYSLIDLRKDVKEAASASGIQSDRRKFAPHITILRGASDNFPQTQISPIRWPSNELVLMRSRPDLSPHTYEALVSVPLSGRSMAKKMEKIKAFQVRNPTLKLIKTVIFEADLKT